MTLSLLNCTKCSLAFSDVLYHLAFFFFFFYFYLVIHPSPRPYLTYTFLSPVYFPLCSNALCVQPLAPDAELSTATSQRGRIKPGHLMLGRVSKVSLQQLMLDNSKVRGRRIVSHSFSSFLPALLQHTHADLGIDFEEMTMAS